MRTADQSSPRQVGNLPRWSEGERFDRGFWTEAPLVDRSQLVRATHVETGARARKRQIANNTTAHAPYSLQNNNLDPGRRVGSLPPWSVVPRFDNQFWTEAPLVEREKLMQDRYELTKGLKKTPHRKDNLISAAQVNADVVPPTPIKRFDNNSGIVRARRRAGADHLTGIAEVSSEAAEAKPRRTPRAERSGAVDHLQGAASVNHDVVPPIPLKRFANNSGIVEARKVHIDHLVGPAVVNRDIVPLDPTRLRKSVHSHFLGGGCQVNPDSVPLEPRKRLQHPPSNLLCGGCILVEEHLSGRGQSGLRDWWGHRASASAGTSSTPRSLQ